MEKIADPYDLKDTYTHWEDCEEFALLIPSGAIGSAEGEWSFCPFCGEYI
jgi:hypothetical protein